MNTPSSVVHTTPLLRVFSTFSRTPPRGLTLAPPIEVRQAWAFPRLMNRSGGWTGPVPFRIDTGADITQMSLEEALSGDLDLDIGTDSGYVLRTTSAGEGWVRVYLGSVRVRFRYPDPDDAAADFEWRCLFVEGLPPGIPPLLGLHDVVNSVRIRFDGTPSLFRPFGAAIFERYDPPT